MAKVERGTTTIVSTGSDAVFLVDGTLEPESIAISVTTNSGAERSVGWSDSVTNYSGNSGTYTDSSSTKSICHYRNISGVKTKVIEGTVTGFDTGEVWFNFTTLTQNTTLTITVYGN